MKRVCLAYSDVEQRFGEVEALKAISFSVEQGEIFGIIGPDGAGKTTLMRLAMGILTPDKGRVHLLGADPVDMRAHVGYVAQRFSLYPRMTVMENIRLFGSLYGGDPQERVERTESILKRTRLWNFRDRYADALSGGMKQKLALASGLVHTPQILFLDEPTTGVDPVARREFWEILYELNREGLSIVVSTPYMDEAELCTKMLFLHQGRLLDQGTMRELLEAFPNTILEVDCADRRIRSSLRNRPAILEANLFGTRYHVEVRDPESAEGQIQALFLQLGLEQAGIRVLKPTLEDLFVSFAREGGHVA